MRTISDYQKASNARTIPRKSKKNLSNPDITFLGLGLSDYFDIYICGCI
jgi:hypothetical protein